MIEIGKTIVSLDIIESKFLCDISKCKGICCVDGDSGAPLTDEEALILEEIYPIIEKYIPENQKQEIAIQGYAIIDSDGDLVTPLVNDCECVYTYREDDGTTKCAIEKAWIAGEVKWQKPISCALFPVRISEYKNFDGVNYQQIDICKCGKELGEKEKLPLWKFLKDPLTRKYGAEWYSQLKLVAETLEMKK